MNFIKTEEETKNWRGQEQIGGDKNKLAKIEMKGRRTENGWDKYGSVGVSSDVYKTISFRVRMYLERMTKTSVHELLGSCDPKDIYS